MKEVYIENGLIYKMSNDQLFSGQAQRVRKNGHLVYEDFFRNGKLIKSVIYYNRTTEPSPSRIIEFYDETEIKRKVTNLGFSEPTTEYLYFNEKGEKILQEQFDNQKLIYRCEYQNNKKHGTEYCVKKDGTELRIEYLNGKRIKEK